MVWTVKLVLAWYLWCRCTAWSNVEWIPTYNFFPVLNCLPRVKKCDPGCYNPNSFWARRTRRKESTIIYFSIWCPASHLIDTCRSRWHLSQMPKKVKTKVIPSMWDLMVPWNKTLLTPLHCIVPSTLDLLNTITKCSKLHTNGFQIFPHRAGVQLTHQRKEGGGLASMRPWTLSRIPWLAWWWTPTTRWCIHDILPLLLSP